MREISYICFNILKRLESVYIGDCGLKLKQLTILRKIGRLHCIFYSSPLTVETSDLTFITSVRYVQLLNKTENRKRKWFWKVLRARYYRYDVHRRNLIGETGYFLLIVCIIIIWNPVHLSKMFLNCIYTGI